MFAKFTKGERVRVHFYGEPRAGTVEDQGPESGIVFVRMDKTGRVQWFHAQSVERANPEPVTTTREA